MENHILGIWGKSDFNDFIDIVEVSSSNFLISNLIQRFSDGNGLKLLSPPVNNRYLLLK